METLVVEPSPPVAPVVPVAFACICHVSVCLLMPTCAVSVTLVSISGKVALVSIGSNLIILPFNEII